MSNVYTPSAGISRRRFLTMTALSAAAAASGCSSVSRFGDRMVGPAFGAMAPDPGFGSDYALMYGPMADGGFELPAIPIERIDRRFLRQVVADPTGAPPGTIVVDTTGHFLYLVQPRGQAIRYGVGLGRAGFEWSGNGVIQWKQKWPKWTPPAEMIARDPKLAKYGVDNGGMPGGLDNPLGARALYIFKDGQDTLYRLHGSPEWSSIGKSVSSGCVRLMNQDIIDLYDRVPAKTPIIVTAGVGGIG